MNRKFKKKIEIKLFATMYKSLLLLCIKFTASLLNKVLIKTKLLNCSVHAII